MAGVKRIVTRTVAGGASVFAVMFLLVAFEQASLDPSHWGSSARGLVSLITGFATVFIGFIAAAVESN